MASVLPYLIFNGNCSEAMAFYQACLGGELSVMTFGETNVESPPEARDRVVHARLTHGPLVLMASDNMPGMQYSQGDSVHVSLHCESADEVDRHYAALAEGGTASVPPHEAFWGARFGMLTDRFGMHWMLNFERSPAASPTPWSASSKTSPPWC